MSVKEILIEMKDTAELLIDLSYSAVLHRNEDLAREVLRLEERMDVLELKGRMSLMMAVRNPATPNSSHRCWASSPRPTTSATLPATSRRSS